jgi:hypothetical protein
METYYTVYKVTNLINGKFYIGTHKTKDQNDEYMGSGTYLKRSQEKHGMNNFKKEILFVYDNPEQMFNKEAELVNEDFLAEENTYNLKLGGFGGWDHLRGSNGNNIKNHRKIGNYGFKITRGKINKKNISEGLFRYFKNNSGNFTNKKHSDETKKKLSEKAKLRTGVKNSQYGVRWIYSLEEKRSTRIKNDEPLPINWLEGRKIKF